MYSYDFFILDMRITSTFVFGLNVLLTTVAGLYTWKPEQKLNDIFDLKVFDKEYDFIVIGAGSAGKKCFDFFRLSSYHTSFFPRLCLRICDGFRA